MAKASSKAVSAIRLVIVTGIFTSLAVPACGQQGDTHAELTSKDEKTTTKPPPAKETVSAAERSVPQNAFVDTAPSAGEAAATHAPSQISAVDSAFKAAARPSAAATSTGANHCGDSLCGQLKLKTKVWAPLAAVAGVAGVAAAAGGAYAGVEASRKADAGKHLEQAEHDAKKEHSAPEAKSREASVALGKVAFRNGPAHEARHDVKQAALPERSPQEAKAGPAHSHKALPTSSAHGAAAGSTLTKTALPNGPAHEATAGPAVAKGMSASVPAHGAGGIAAPVFQTMAPSSAAFLGAHPAPMAGAVPGALPLPRAVPAALPTTRSPKEPNVRWAWILGCALVFGVCCICVCALALLLFLWSDSKSARKCTRRLCPSSESEATPRPPKVSPFPSRSRERATSDVEDAPLLPEGSALPKFWDWLGNW